MSNLKALIFDVDGVIAETEACGHRIAFNKVFKEENLGVEWDVKTYGEKLKIAGGKERMKTIVYDPSFKKDVGDKEEYIKKLHKRKTDVYMEMIERGELKARPGVARLIKEAKNTGLRLGIATTSDIRGVTFLIQKVLGEDIFAMFDIVLAGDVVKKKKPDPEIYNLAKEKLELDASECLVVEDTENGFKAAKGAGMKCLVTKSEYSRDENFDGALVVVDEIGDSEISGVTIEKLKKIF